MRLINIKTKIDSLGVFILGQAELVSSSFRSSKKRRRHVVATVSRRGRFSFSVAVIRFRNFPRQFARSFRNYC